MKHLQIKVPRGRGIWIATAEIQLHSPIMCGATSNSVAECNVCAPALFFPPTLFLPILLDALIGGAIKQAVVNQPQFFAK
jgi:hypothetical protein